ncbi:MAG: class II aldolase/adducin family protein, partial [Candidatus Omnitrophota bacterium]
VLSTLTNSDGRAIIVRQDGEIYQHVMFWTSDKIAADVMIGSIQPTTSSADARNGERAKREGVALVEIAVDGSGNNVARASSSVTFSPATESVLRDLITTTNYQAEFLDTVKRTRDLGHGLVSMSVTYKGKIFIIDNGADTFIELNDITATDRDRLTHLAAHRKNPNIPVLMISHPHDEIHELIRQGVPIGPLSPDHVVLTQERGELVVVANVEDIRFPERVATSLKEHNLVLTEEGAVVAAGSHDLEAAYAIWMAAETAKTMVAGLVAGSGQPLLSLTTRQVDALMGSGYEKERSGRMKVRRSKPLVKSGPTDVLRIERASDPNNERVIEETWRLRAELVRGGQGLAAGNLVVGPGGNISVRLHSNPNIVLIKAKGSAFESMEADEYVAVDLETGKPIEMDGLGPAYSPSTETTIHLAVYREHPGTYAVCHTHPSLATGIATAGQTFAVRGIPCQRFDFLEPGSPLFASSVAGAIGKGAVLIANHGIFTMGITLGEAIDHNFSVEYAAGEIVLHRPWAATTTGFSAAAVASAQMV